MNDLANKMQEISHRRVSSAPPSARDTVPQRDSLRANTVSPTHSRHGALPSPGTPLDLEVDWNRLVIGGWHLDTRREKIESEARQLLQTFGLHESVTDVTVYGRRASACHVLLQHLQTQEAKRRLGRMPSPTQRQTCHPKLRQGCVADPSQEPTEAIEKSCHQARSQHCGISPGQNPSRDCRHRLEQANPLGS